MATKTLKFNWQHLLPWLLPIAILTSWQFLAQLGFITSRTMPAPLDVVKAGITVASSGELWHHLLVSTRRALLGLAIGGSIGFTLGLITGVSRVAESLLDSTIQMIRNVPLLAIIPLVILWFGIDETGKIFLVSLSVFFPLYINTYHGIRSVDKGLIEMGGVYGLSRWGLFQQVILPGALPSILVGLRLSLGYMWLFLVVAETIASSEGIGYMTMNAREFLQTDVVVLGITIYALLGIASDQLANQLEHRWLKWHAGYRAA